MVRSPSGFPSELKAHHQLQPFRFVYSHTLSSAMVLFLDLFWSIDKYVSLAVTGQLYVDTCLYRADQA